MAVKANHADLEVKKCGLFINKGKAFLHATPCPVAVAGMSMGK